MEKKAEKMEARLEQEMQQKDRTKKIFFHHTREKVAYLSSAHARRGKREMKRGCGEWPCGGGRRKIEE